MMPAAPPLTLPGPRLPPGVSRRLLRLGLAALATVPLAGSAKADLLEDLSGVLSITCQAQVVVTELSYLCKIRENIEQIAPLLRSGKWEEFGKDPLKQLSMIGEVLAGVEGIIAPLDADLAGEMGRLRQFTDGFAQTVKGDYLALLPFNETAKQTIAKNPALQSTVQGLATQKANAVTRSGTGVVMVRESQEAVTNGKTIAQKSVETAAKVLAPGVGKADTLALRLKASLSTRDAIEVQTEASLELLRQTAYSNTNVVNMLSSQMVQGAVTNAQLSELITATYLQIDQEMNEITGAINSISTSMDDIREANKASGEMADKLAASMMKQLELK